MCCMGDTALNAGATPVLDRVLRAISLAQPGAVVRARDVPIARGHG